MLVIMDQDIELLAGEPIHLIGVEFSRKTRNVTAFEVADDS